MNQAKNLTPGMTISVEGNIFRVESSVKVTVAKGLPFLKTKLKDLMTDELIERNFNLDEDIQEVSLSERRLEYLYPDGKNHLFLDIDHLEQVFVSNKVIGDKLDYLKEGIQIKAMFYGDTVFSVELPQFLELMITKTEAMESNVAVSNASKIGVLETGAKVEVPLFIETGDVIKVDTQANEYVQRI